jgi:predicted CXXCH cytochrome family protein
VIDTKGITIPSPKSLYEDSDAVLHRPFVEGKCNACHFPHRGDKYRLLKGNYPTGVYSPYSEEAYSLCLGCHKDMAQSLDKPRTLGGTKFRNGNLNLHHRHVNKKKGRTCRSCHDHHGSKNPRLVKETLKIRKVELPMEFAITETGGSCTPSCHTAVMYDRYEPVGVTMKTTPREGKDATPEELKTSRKLDSQNWEQGRAEGGEQKKNIQ